MWGAQGIEVRQQLVVELNFNPRPSWDQALDSFSRITFTYKPVLQVVSRHDPVKKTGSVCVLESLVDFRWRPALSFSIRSLGEQSFGGSMALLRAQWWPAHLTSWQLLPPSVGLLPTVVYHHSLSKVDCSRLRFNKGGIMLSQCD